MIMSMTTEVCPGCGLAAARKNGRDRQGRQLHQCRGCQRRFTARSATPFAGYRFPPDVIALAVRWLSWPFSPSAPIFWQSLLGGARI